MFLFLSHSLHNSHFVFSCSNLYISTAFCLMLTFLTILIFLPETLLFIFSQHLFWFLSFLVDNSLLSLNLFQNRFSLYLFYSFRVTLSMFTFSSLSLSPLYTYVYLCTLSIFTSTFSSSSILSTLFYILSLLKCFIM